MKSPGVGTNQERTYTLAKEVKLIIGSKEVGLADLKPGTHATLSLDREGQTVQTIAVRGANEVMGRQRDENAPKTDGKRESQSNPRGEKRE